MENGFSVPIHLRDLELPTSRYVVSEEVASAGVPKTAGAQKAEVARLKDVIDAEGAGAIVEHFDALYVLTRDAASLDEGARAKLAVVLCATALGAAAGGEALRPGVNLPQAELQAGRDAFLMAAVLAQEVIASCDAAAETEGKKPAK